MSTIAWVIVITALSGVVGTGLGGVVGAVFRKDSSKIVSLLLSFAGGVMLAVVCFDLIPEAMQVETSNSKINVLIAIVGIIVGFGVVFGLNRLIDNHTKKEVEHVNEQEHPKTHDALDELIHADHLTEHRKSGTNRQLFIAGIVMAFAIALHNVPEGMVIGASYASSDSVSLAAGSGFVLAVIIGLHNIPEGMAVSVPLITGGMKKWVAIIVTAVTGIPTILGAILGYYVGAMSPLGLTIALSFASGAMLYVVLGELLPEAYLMFKSKLPATFVLIGILVGVALVQI